MDGWIMALHVYGSRWKYLLGPVKLQKKNEATIQLLWPNKFGQ